MNIEKIVSTGKTVVKNLSNIGIGVFFGNIATVLVPEIGIPLRICTTVGAYVLGCMVADKADEYIDEKVEEIKTEITENSEEG